MKKQKEEFMGSDCYYPFQEDNYSKKEKINKKKRREKETNEEHWKKNFHKSNSFKKFRKNREVNEANLYED